MVDRYGNAITAESIGAGNPTLRMFTKALRQRPDDLRSMHTLKSNASLNSLTSGTSTWEFQRVNSEDGYGSKQNDLLAIRKRREHNYAPNGSTGDLELKTVKRQPKNGVTRMQVSEQLDANRTAIVTVGQLRIPEFFSDKTIKSAELPDMIKHGITTNRHFSSRKVHGGKTILHRIPRLPSF